MLDHDIDRMMRCARAFIRGGTMLVRRDSSIADTREGTGGSHVGGAAYVERGDVWPTCPCGVAMACELQIDHAGARHEPVVPGLFVAFAASARHRLDSWRTGSPCPRPTLLRYYPMPSPARRDVDVHDPALGPDDAVTRLEPAERCELLPPDSLLDQLVPDLASALAAESFADPWQHVYARMLEATGMTMRLMEDHLGGWHYTDWSTQRVPPRCPACGEHLATVVTLEWGDGNRTLWACPSHPQHAEYGFHK